MPTPLRRRLRLARRGLGYTVAIALVLVALLLAVVSQVLPGERAMGVPLVKEAHALAKARGASAPEVLVNEVIDAFREVLDRRSNPLSRSWRTTLCHVRLGLESLPSLLRGGVPAGTGRLFLWRGAIDTARECGALFKTDASKVDELVARLVALHPYETPAVLGWPCPITSTETREWIRSAVVKGDAP